MAQRFGSTLLATSLLLLGACGGGGGGGDGGGSAPGGTGTLPPPAFSLAMSPDNAVDVSTAGVATGSLVMSIGHMAADFGDRFVTRGDPLSIAESCSEQGGTLKLTLDDKDGNGVVSAGDMISAQLSDCFMPTLARQVTGSLSVDVTKLDKRPFGTIGGVVRIAGLVGQNLLELAATGASGTLLGSLQFESAVSQKGSSIHTWSSTADDLRLLTAAGSRTLTDSVRQFDFSKTVDLPHLAATITLASQHGSELLNGSFAVVTSAPLSVSLGRKINAGSIKVTGLNSELSLLPDTSGKNGYMEIQISNVKEHKQLALASGTTGFLWWNELGPLRWGYAVYPYGSIGGGTMGGAEDTSSTVIPVFWHHDARDDASRQALFRMLAGRELLPVTGIRFRFHDSAAPSIEGPGDIGADMVQDGALLSFQPREQLRHGHGYVLQAALDGQTWLGSDDWVLRSPSGARVTLRSFALIDFVTRDSLKAAIVPSASTLFDASASVRLSGEGSASTRLPIVAWKWTQLSGTPLRFSAPESPVTDVAWDSAPASIEYPEIRLTVTDARGEIEYASVTLSSANPSSMHNVLSFSSAPDDPIGHGASVVSSGDAASFFAPMTEGRDYTLMMYFPPAGSAQQSWTLTLYTADRSPLRIGHYGDAGAAYFPGANNAMSFAYLNEMCTVSYGSFDVLDISHDASGQITSIAIDFEQRCERPDALPLLGSYRFNSPLPVRR